MKGFQRFLIGFVIFLLALPVVSANAASFSDVERYHDEIGYLVDEGVLTGYPDGSFKPNAHMNRLNGVQVLLRAKGITDFDAPNPGFTDMTPETHGYAEVAKAVELGIISGKTNADGTRYFDPKGSLTRGQMAKIIVETMDYPIDTSYTFRDVPTSNGYVQYISTLAAAGVTEGYADNTFKPNLAVSRQHFSLFVARMLNDAFKPEPKPTSFIMDKDLIYTREVVDGNRSYLEESRYIGPEFNGDEEWDLWLAIGDGEREVFVLYENEQDLRSGTPQAHAYIDLVYPLYKGKVFESDSFAYDTVLDVGLTYTTKAGTFEQVVMVKNHYGYIVYYAPNIGAIKTVKDGKTLMELVKVTPRD